jgi:hypothetical protein
LRTDDEPAIVQSSEDKASESVESNRQTEGLDVLKKIDNINLDLVGASVTENENTNLDSKEEVARTGIAETENMNREKAQQESKTTDDALTMREYVSSLKQFASRERDVPNIFSEYRRDLAMSED